MIYQMHKNHGRHISYTVQEAQANRNNGWRDVEEKEFYEIPARRMSVVSDDHGGLVKAYTEKFGKPPHHRMKDQSIKAALHAEIP